MSCRFGLNNKCVVAIQNIDFSSNDVVLDVVSFDVVSFDVVSFDVVSFDVVSFDVVSFDVVSFDVDAFEVVFRGQNFARSPMLSRSRLSTPG